MKTSRLLLLAVYFLLFSACNKDGQQGLPDHCSKPLFNFSLPNAFTPNNDGLNDGFRSASPIGWGNYTMTIYTLDGAVVFQSMDPLQAWDGRGPNGNLMTEKIFRYTIDATIGGQAYNLCSYFHMIPVMGACIPLAGMDSNPVKFGDQFNPFSGNLEYETAEDICP